MRSRAARSVCLAALWVILVVPAGALAHHILGIPHYAYEEDYPQTPVLTYRVNAGLYEVRMTGYPGVIEAGQRCSLHVYIKRLEGGDLFDGVVTATVTRDRFIADDPIIYGPVSAELEERVYKFFPEFAAEGDYAIHIEFEAAGEPWTIELPIVVGNPGSPWAVLGFVSAGLVVFLIVIRAARIKLRRRQMVSARGREATRPRGRRIAALSTAARRSGP